MQRQERILKAAREKQEVMYKGALIKLADFSTETPQARREWQEISQVMKSKGLQPSKTLYPARLSIKMDSEIRTLPDQVESKNTPLPNQHCNIC